MADEFDLMRALDLPAIKDILEQPEVDRVIGELVEYKNPIRQNFPRKAGSGHAWLLNRRTPGTTPGAFVSDTDTLVEDTSKYERVEFEYKTIATRGRVTRKAQAVGKTYRNLLADEIEAKTRDFRDFEDWALLWGDTAVDARQFDGIHKLIPTEQTIATTTAVDGGPLTLSILDQAIDKCMGEPNMIITSARTRRQINALIQSQQRFVDAVEVKGGFKVMTYNGIPIFTSTNVYDDWFFDGTNIVGHTGETSTLYILNTEEVWVGVLQEVKYQPLAMVSSQYTEFDIFADECVVVRNPKAHVKIIGIK